MRDEENLFHGKTILITGANSGIGYEISQLLSQLPCQLIVSCRTLKKAEQTIQRLQENAKAKLSMVWGDFSKLEEVNAIVNQVHESQIDLLINNAGFLPASRMQTPYQIDESFIINQLSPLLLTTRLLPLLSKSPSPHVCFITSKLHYLFNLPQNYHFNKIYHPYYVYAVAKLANTLTTVALAKKYPHIRFNCVHPGVVNSNFGSSSSHILSFIIRLVRPFLTSSQQAAQDVLNAIQVANEQNLNGEYFEEARIKKLPSQLRNSDFLLETYHQYQQFIAQILSDKGLTYE